MVDGQDIPISMEGLPKLMIVLGLVLLLAGLIVLSSFQLFLAKNVGSPKDFDSWCNGDAQAGESIMIEGKIAEEKVDLNGYAYRFSGSQNFFSSQSDVLDEGDEIRVEIVWKFDEAHMVSYRESRSFLLTYEILPLVSSLIGVALLVVGFLFMKRRMEI